MDRPEIDKTLREHIAVLRGEKTQEETADLLKIPRSTYRNWEDGSRKIKAADIAFLSESFGVSSDWLLGLTDDRSPSTEIRAMRDYTGLDDSSLHILHSFPHVSEMIKLLCAAPDVLLQICDAMNRLYDCAAIMTEAIESGNYDYEERRKVANTCLFDFEESMRNVTIYQGVRDLRDRLKSPAEIAMERMLKEAK